MIVFEDTVKRIAIDAEYGSGGMLLTKRTQIWTDNGTSLDLNHFAEPEATPKVGDRIKVTIEKATK